MKSLVVYYSRTGNTKKAAEKFAELLKADIESVNDRRDRCGILGYLSALFDATFERASEIHETKYDPSSYDLVIIGTPIWSGNMSAAIKTYLIQNQGKFKTAAFFYCGGMDTKTIFENMEELTGAKPIATIGIMDNDILDGSYVEKIKRFILELNRSL